MLKRLLISALCLSAMDCFAYAKPTWVTQEFQSGVCKDIETGDVDKGEDYIIRQCESFPGVSTWIAYQEGARMFVGFGKKPNSSLSGADANRGEWPIEWGGEKQNGKFVPQVAIGRFTIAGEEPPVQHLYVFRLLSNGMSCIVGDVATNVKAKTIATSALKKWTCMSEATPIELK